MIEVVGFVQQEHIGKGQAEQDGGQPIKKPEGDEQREYAHDSEMNIHPVPWPGSDKIQERVCEVVGGGDVVSLNPVMLEVAQDLPGHETAK